MKLALLLLFLMIPAVSAVGLLVPPAFDSTVRVYTSNSTSINVSVKGDSSNNTVTFFASSPDARLLINGVRSYSTTFVLSAGQLRATTLRLTGSNSTPELTVEYGFLLGNSSVSTGIGFQQVTKDTFKARVYCTGSCVSAPAPGPVPVVPKSTPNGGGAGVVPLPKMNVSVNSSASNPIRPPILNDLAGASGSVDTMQSSDKAENNVPQIPISTNEVQQIISASSLKTAGKWLALVLVGMFISLLLLEVAVYSLVKRMQD